MINCLPWEQIWLILPDYGGKITDEADQLVPIYIGN